ncbi:MAG: hypothetical protein H6674_02920 [Dehalococcoidia bacterium]|nr:hypothetical protein [Dehalococcoidia bacterium]
MKVIVVAGIENLRRWHDLGTEEMRSEIDEFPRDMVPRAASHDGPGVYFASTTAGATSPSPPSPWSGLLHHGLVDARVLLRPGRRLEDAKFATAPSAGAW